VKVEFYLIIKNKHCVGCNIVPNVLNSHKMFPYNSMLIIYFEDQFWCQSFARKIRSFPSPRNHVTESHAQNVFVSVGKLIAITSEVFWNTMWNKDNFLTSQSDLIL